MKFGSPYSLPPSTRSDRYPLHLSSAWQLMIILYHPPHLRNCSAPLLFRRRGIPLPIGYSPRVPSFRPDTPIKIHSSRRSIRVVQPLSADDLYFHLGLWASIFNIFPSLPSSKAEVILGEYLPCPVHLGKPLPRLFSCMLSPTNADSFKPAVASLSRDTGVQPRSTPYPVMPCGLPSGLPPSSLPSTGLCDRPSRKVKYTPPPYRSHPRS